MIRIVLFSGFLGAGKTTILANLLPELAARGKVALLVNDFGKISLDGALLSRCGLPLREIAGGSIFCVCKQANLIQQLTDIAHDIAPELLVIEASGLAEPTDTAALLQNTDLRKLYSLPEVVTVVDAVNYRKLSRILRVLPMQVKIADTIIIAKADLVSSEELDNLKNELSQLNWDACILESVHGKLHGELLLNATQIPVRSDAPLQLCAAATPGFGNYQFASSEPVERAALEALLKSVAANLLRAKGVVYFTNGEICRIDAVNGEWRFTIAESDLQERYPSSWIFFALKGDENKNMYQRLTNLKLKG